MILPARPDMRIGPRPLGLHLGLASSTLASSLAALPLAMKGQYPWMPEIREEAEELRSQMQEFELQKLLLELGARGHHLVEEMLSGIQKYHAHSYKREISQCLVVWSHGSARVLDYGSKVPKGAPIAFIVPSLVNRGYILDLMPGRSFVRALADAGIRPLLMDWGTPGDTESNFSLEDYILKILAPALEAIRQTEPETPVHLLGYCMGGTLAVAQAQLQQDKFSSLIALAAPWNFHDGLSTSAQFFLGQEETWQTVLGAFGELPVDMIQAFFASLDPNLCLRKFGMFNRLDMASRRAMEFVALEDWLNDGVPLVKNVALECFSAWYGENDTFGGRWSVGGKAISPQKIMLPALVAVPKSDRIVPPGSALGLAEQLPNATVVTPPSGHIGMVAGSRAESGLWKDVIDWIKS